MRSRRTPEPSGVFKPSLNATNAWDIAATDYGEIFARNSSERGCRPIAQTLVGLPARWAPARGKRTGRTTRTLRHHRCDFNPSIRQIRREADNWQDVDNNRRAGVSRITNVRRIVPPPLQCELPRCYAQLFNRLQSPARVIACNRLMRPRQRCVSIADSIGAPSYLNQ
jgi:hypothetical protein